MASDDALVARDGDVLVVSYPEIKIPIAPYSTVGVGGLTYSRQLQAGDDPDEQYARIYRFLEARANQDARAKVATWSEELNRDRQSKPAAGSRR